MTRVSVHDIAKHTAPIGSEEGQRLMRSEASVDRDPLMECWVAQLESHCGAASAVIVINALRPEERLTQDDLFTPETAQIITQEVVFRLGFTLEELTEMIRVRTGLQAQWFRAGTGEGQHGYEDFLAALRADRANPGDHLIVNFSQASLAGEGTGRGHFSPIAGFSETDDMVLVLEVRGDRELFWVSPRELYSAIETVDPVCGLNRGWIVVSR